MSRRTPENNRKRVLFTYNLNPKQQQSVWTPLRFRKSNMLQCSERKKTPIKKGFSSFSHLHN